MERKQQHSKEEEEERINKSSTITINGDIDDDEIHVSEKHDDDDDDLSILKKEIACHSMYGFLVQSHLGCLKLCLGNNIEDMDNIVIDPTAANSRQNLITADPTTELDKFMEAYCMTLNKVKEVIEKPQQESMAFINYMYSQLEELQDVDHQMTAELK